jgi:hypothetical protein
MEKTINSDHESETEEKFNAADLMKEMAKMMKHMAAMQATAMGMPQPPVQPLTVSEGSIHPNPIDAKFDGTNYAFWCQAVEMYIRGRERMKHLTGKPEPPSVNDPTYNKWETDDVVVKGWLINSLEPRLRDNYIRYPTTRDVWKAIETTYYDGGDEAQLHALYRQINSVRQAGRAIEEYYDDLQRLWQEINFHCPNPMECPRDIDKFNLHTAKNRVYTFLDGLDDALDGVRAQVVLLKPFPTVPEAYGYVRREAIRQGVMLKEGNTSSLAMVARGFKPKEVTHTFHKNTNFPDKSKLKCSHCGGTRHTREQCFEIIGYPEWYKGKKKEKKPKGMV